MVYLTEYPDEVKQENLQKLTEYKEQIKTLNLSQLHSIFNDLLFYFNEDKIYYPSLNYNEESGYNVLRFMTNTANEKFEEKKKRVMELDFNISFDHPLQQYEIMYTKTYDDKEYINIKFFASNTVVMEHYLKQDTIKKLFSAYPTKDYELIIYSIDAIFIKYNNNKILPLSFKNVCFHKNEIMKIIFQIFSKYKPIFKDVLKETFKRSANIIISDIAKCHTKKEVLENIFKIKLFNAINKYTLSDGYVICCALKLIDENLYNVVYKYASTLCNNFSEYFLSENTKRYDIGISFLADLYLNKLNDCKNKSTLKSSIIENYFKYNEKNGKITFKITSEDKIKTYFYYYKVENALRKNKSINVTKKNPFNEFELPSNFIRIKTKKQFIDFCKITKINVISYYRQLLIPTNAMYALKINNDYFAIFVKASKSYNELNNKNYKYSLVTIISHNNQRTCPELYTDMYNIIKYNNKNKLGGLINEL